MNIIEARAAAISGKTVISPLGVEFSAREFSDEYGRTWINEMVFGEWKIKLVPVFIEGVLGSRDMGNLLSDATLDFVGQRVRVKVEVVG